MSKKIETIRQANKIQQTKKIVLTIVLLVIVGVLAYVVIAKPTVEKNNSNAIEFVQVNENKNNVEQINSEDVYLEDDTKTNIDEIEITDASVKDSTITKYKDGTLYAISGESVKPELIIGNNYFDTQLQDVSLNFSKYEGKTVEIEGFFIENTPYTFVGRYSESNLCPTCPAGYSYFEYEWHGKDKLNLTNETEWIKVVGTFKRNVDETGEYYYIDASSIKVMNEWGQDTVKN